MAHRTAAIYCRISKDRAGAGLGIERQEADCRELAARLGWTVAAVHADNDISAYSGKPRPGYQALLADVAAGRADAVLAWHTDRLHRSTVELEGYISVCEPRGVPTHCVKAGPLDLSTASGRMTARITGAVARHEVEHMVERQRAAKRQAATAGRYRGGRRPFGYEADGVTVRVAEAAAVADASSRVLAGESLCGLARDWNAHGLSTTGGKAWTSAALRPVLLRARNAAIVSHEGEVIGPARWPAIVSEEVWRAVCTVLADPARRHAQSTETRWIGSGLFRCGVCGDGTCVRTASSSRDQRSYRCKARAHLARKADPVDELVTALVLERLSAPDAHLLLRSAPGIDTAALSVQAAALRVRSCELVSLLCDGVITRAEVAEGKARIGARLAQIATEMASAAAGSPLAGFADAADVSAAWQRASISRRKSVIDALMTVTLAAPGRGMRCFDPATVQIAWRSA
ncbi:MAG: recombinase family protein [Pseudonocardiaceae bacterium]